MQASYDDLMKLNLCDAFKFVEEPEHSAKVIKDIQQKYNISDDDLIELKFAFSMLKPTTEE